jgi:hypothetical protein
LRRVPRKETPAKGIRSFFPLGALRVGPGWSLHGDCHRGHGTSRITWAKLVAPTGKECPRCGGDIRLRGDGRQEPASVDPEVRKLKKARMASPA